MTVPLKESGVDWLGQIPAHWDVVPPTALFAESKERARDGDQMLSATQKYGVIPLADFEALEGRQVTKAIANLEMRKHAEIGDFVISMRSMDGGLERSRAVGSVRSSYTVLKPGPDVEGRFYGALFKSSLFIQALRLTSNFIRDGQDLNFGHVRKLRLPKPPHAEQAAIADYLDRAISRTDALISKKIRFIELLREKRQALITHAVTRGLDAAAPMKDSGVEWLGEVPVHWSVVKFGRIARVTEGLVDPRIEPYLSMLLIAPNHVESGTGRLISLETAEDQNAESGKYYCREGSIIYSKIRPALAKAVLAPRECLCSADMYPLNCADEISPKWLLNLLLSQAFTSWALLESDRVAMPKINRESLYELIVAVPPLSEQLAITAEINARLPRIDALIATTERSIDLLREHRTALITAAVTGKIDLRDAP